MRENKKKKLSKSNKKNLLFLPNKFGEGNSECTHTNDQPVPNPLPGYGGYSIEIGPNWVYHLSYCKPDPDVYPDQARNQPWYYLHVTAYYNVHAQIGMQLQGDIRCSYGFKPQKMNPNSTGHPQPMAWETANWRANIGDDNINGNAIKAFCMSKFNDPGIPKTIT